jgi:hypothetical protein
MDKATIAKTNAETIIGASEAGLVSRETAMMELRQSSGDTGIFTNISDEEIKEAAEEEPPMPEMDVEQKPEEPKEPVKNLDSKWRFPWNKKKK